MKILCQANTLREVLEEPPVDQEGRLIHVGVMLLHPVLHAEQSVGFRAELLHIPCLIHGNLSLKQSCRRVSPDAHKDAVA